MGYAEMLDEIISESELSLRQISNLCKQFNISITPSYISQLKNGKLPPPSPEVSLALAKVCNSKKQAQLVFQGYMEKAPDVIREYMLAFPVEQDHAGIPLQSGKQSNVRGSVELSQKFRRPIHTGIIFKICQFRQKSEPVGSDTRDHPLKRWRRKGSGSG